MFEVFIAAFCLLVHLVCLAGSLEVVHLLHLPGFLVHLPIHLVHQWLIHLVNLAGEFSSHGQLYCD